MSMSQKKCCVPGCIEGGGSHKVLHSFPNPEKERERFTTWVLSIGGDLIGMDNKNIHKYRRVCHAHFKIEHCCRFERLSNIAVPTLKMPGPTTLPRFTDTEQRRLGSSQSLENMPSTSVSLGDHVLFEETPRMAVVTTESSHEISKENIEPTTLSTFTDTEQRQLRSRHSFENMPSTSGLSGDYVLSKVTPRMAAVNTESSHEIAKENIERSGENSKTENIVSKNTAVEENTVRIPSRSILREIQNISQETEQKKLIESTQICDQIQKKTKRQKMTKVEQSLYRKLIGVKVKLSKCKTKIKKQKVELKAAKNIMSNPKFLTVLDSLPSTAKILTMLQFREYKKKSKGRRFTMEEKIVALSLLKQSPKAYRFLRKMFLLPAQHTLAKLINQANIKPGLNKKIFAQIKQKADKMKIEERLCVLLFDEMSLKANITYNERRDKVIGFVSNGESSSQEFADHAQVFMVRGLIKNYKQPVAYTFSQAATKGPELARQIKIIINELQKAGFIVFATVCDQGSNNRQALKLLINETRGYCLREGRTPKETVFEVNNQEIVTIYDPPHLLKGIRNNLLTKDLKYTIKGTTQTAKWQHLELFNKENPTYQGIRLVKKITDNHILPQKIGKMKVKYAAQLFSETVAGNIGYLADKGILPVECKETADLLIFWDKLFDSFNGSYQKNKYAKPLLGPCTPTSPHQKQWEESKKILDSMKFVDKNGKLETIPSITNWKWTINSVEILINNLKNKYGISSIWMRHLNQDPLENFFGAIRSHGVRNTNPTPERFESAYASLLINSLTTVHAAAANCENDFCKALYALIITEDEDCKANLSTDLNIDSILNINFKPVEDVKDVRIKAPLQYVSGYFIKQTKKKIFKNCATCKENLVNPTPIEYIQYREYGGKNWLCSPHNDAIELVSNMQDIIFNIIKQDIQKNNLKAYLKTTILMLVDFKIVKCVKHKDDLVNFLIAMVIRMFLHNYCKNINRILSGRKDVDENENDLLQNKAKKYYKKCYKRKM